MSSSLPNDEASVYKYDVTGRMSLEKTNSSSKEYSYGWLDKVMNIRHIDGMKGLDETTSFAYHIDGQLAERKVTGGAERFYWDGLALIKRGETSYINDPSVTGGNPILADNDVLFNDMLGTTLGSVKNGTFNEIALTSFGASESQTSKPPVARRFFTGKPHVDGLGYAFLFRNYRPELGKWQTSDPLGYPDGWNNFAYCNNWVISCIDRFGTDVYHVVASDAVFGAGHSATIIGNPTDGYSFYSFGSGPSSSGESGTGYSSYEDALDGLKATRGPEDAPYDRIQEWDTTAAQDQAALAEAVANIDDWYIPLVYDCLWFVYECLEEAGVDFDRSAQTPNGAFDENIQYTNVIAE